MADRPRGDRKILSRLRSERRCKSIPYNVNGSSTTHQRLQTAVCQGDVDGIISLLNGGASPNTYDEKNLRSPLHIAAAKGDYDVCRIMLQAGADPNARDLLGNTPLHLAAISNQLPLVILLIKSGADVSNQCSGSLTTLRVLSSRLAMVGDGSGAANQSRVNQLLQIVEVLRVYTRAVDFSEGIHVKLPSDLVEVDAETATDKVEDLVDDIQSVVDKIQRLQMNSDTEHSINSVLGTG